MNCCWHTFFFSIQRGAHWDMNYCYTAGCGGAGMRPGSPALIKFVWMKPINLGLHSYITINQKSVDWLWCMSAGASFPWKIPQVWGDLNHFGSCRIAPNWSFAVILITRWAAFWDCVRFSRLHWSCYCLTCWFWVLITKHLGFLGCDWLEERIYRWPKPCDVVRQLEMAQH